MKPRELAAIKNTTKKRNTYIEKAKVMKPWLGTLLFVLYTVIMSSNNYVSKALFEHNPKRNIWELTFARGFIALTMMMIRIGKNAKAELWDAVQHIERSLIPYLIFRCFQTGASLVVMFICIKYFPVSIVGIVCCLAPPLQMILAGPFLDEWAQAKDWI